MVKKLRLFEAVLAALVSLGAVPTAKAWGCAGHEIIALIAEKHLDPRAKRIAVEILASDPIDPGLSRYCEQGGLDPFADASTWADDERALRPETAAWHFIDIPRGARQSDLAQYCPASTGCLVSALAAQLAVLKDESVRAEARADALRYVIHLVGDIHQPLHASTNNDRGGNCVPVWFFGRAPSELNRANQSYSPNLHEIWDVDIIDRFADGRSPQEIAHELDRNRRAPAEGDVPDAAEFFAWAWESHELAEAMAYGRLPHKIPLEQPREISSCADDDVALRMLRLRERLGQAYQDAAAPVAQKQLEKAGLRLAGLLNSLWP